LSFVWTVEFWTVEFGQLSLDSWVWTVEFGQLSLDSWVSEVLTIRRSSSPLFTFCEEA